MISQWLAHLLHSTSRVLKSKSSMADATTVQWLTSGYSLVEAVVIPLSAYLIGRFSTRQRRDL